jgi:hypothetical protein
MKEYTHERVIQGVGISPPISSKLDYKVSLTEIVRRRWERYGSWR